MPEARGVIESIFKPEARNKFSDNILLGFKEYYHAVFQSSQYIEYAKLLDLRDEVIIPTGSVRRGTAIDSAISDLDALVLWNSPSRYNSEGEDLGSDKSLIQDANGCHPTGLSIPQYLERRKITTGVIKLEYDFAETNELVDSINMGKERNSVSKDFKHIADILTTTENFAAEANEGALRNHQKRIVEALLDLKKSKPKMFETAYGEISQWFKKSLFFLKGNEAFHKESFESQVREYLKSTSRFSQERLNRAVNLFISVRENLDFPPIESFADMYGVNR